MGGTLEGQKAFRLRFEACVPDEDHEQHHGDSRANKAFCMTVYAFPLKNALRRSRGCLAIAGLAVLVAVGTVNGVDARSNRGTGPSEAVASRVAATPIMAIVSLRNQRVTIYDSQGWILRAPVSSGQTGYETPAGIYSVIQKEAEHYSNLYDDAYMPNMQRLTWSGIALHGGPLPGYAASHGCVRMPYEFAQHLFELTSIGMRVIVAPDDISPIEIVHPALFKPRPVVDAATGAQSSDGPIAAQDKDPPRPGALPSDAGGSGPANSGKPPLTLKSIAAAKADEADAAVRKADEARLTALKLTREATQVLRTAEIDHIKAQSQLAAAENTLKTSSSPTTLQQAQDAKAKALEKIGETEAQLAVAEIDAGAKADAAARAKDQAQRAEVEKSAALEAAKEAKRKAAPVSVLISRKTHRLYVRQNFQPVFDAPVDIQDSDQPIGTHIYTALDYTNEDTDLRWSALTLESGPDAIRPSRRSDRHHEADAESTAGDASSSKAALDRVGISPDVVERISEVMSPGSSLIVTDEGISSETGEATDFIVLMSNEPQGGIKIRRHGPEASRYDRPYRASPYYGGSYGRYGDDSYGRPMFGGGPFFRW